MQIDVNPNNVTLEIIVSVRGVVLLDKVLSGDHMCLDTDSLLLLLSDIPVRNSAHARTDAIAVCLCRCCCRSSR